MATFGSVQRATEASAASRASTAPLTKPELRHAAFVRVTHWISALAFFGLLISGIEIVISHPRFYWGETGTVLTTPLFQLPIPSSRRLVPTGYGYVLPDQNGWSRALHFQTAWILAFTGLLYVIPGLLNGHFRRNLIPGRMDCSGEAFKRAIANHLRFVRLNATEAWSYNLLQRLTYSLVIFVSVPADHLDGAGNVSRVCICFSPNRYSSGRP